MRTPEEKERIVLEAIERGARRTAEAHGVDPSLLQRRIAKYRAAGVDGLTDRRGDVRPYFDGLAQAIEAMKGKEQSDPTILHTDRGAVYSSRAFNELLSNHAVVHSMSRAGTPTDNPIDESLNGWIKDELFIDFNLRKCDDVLSLIKAYVDYYNNERPMCYLGYKTPHQYRTDMGY